jgi:hypothetical protein
LPQFGRFLGFGRHHGDDAINGIFFWQGPPLPPKVGRGSGASPDITPQVSTRQGKDGHGIFLKLLRDQFMLRKADLIEHFVLHGLKLLMQYNKRLMVPRQPGKPCAMKKTQYSPPATLRVAMRAGNTPALHHSGCRITIVSGGQTGADRAALDWALAHNVECAGWCPKGRKAEDGPIDAKYPLKETPFNPRLVARVHRLRASAPRPWLA